MNNVYFNVGLLCYILSAIMVVFVGYTLNYDVIQRPFFKTTIGKKCIGYILGVCVVCSFIIVIKLLN